MRNLTQEIKLKIYNEYNQSGISMPDLAKKYNTSVSSIYKLRKETESQNTNPLTDKQNEQSENIFHCNCPNTNQPTDKQNEQLENTFHCTCPNTKEHLIIMSCIANL